MQWQLLAVAAVSTAATAAFVVIPWLPLGYRAPSLHVALETSAALISLLAMFLVFGRLQRDARVADLVLACGLAVLAMSNFLFREVPAVFEARSDRGSVWAAVGGRLLGAMVLAAGATAPTWRLRDPRRAVAAGALAAGAAVVATGVAGWLLRSHVPVPGGLFAGSHVSARHPDFAGHPGFSAIQLVAGALYAVAVFGFAQRATRRNDEFLHWLALACMLSVFSRISYFLYPSSYTDLGVGLVVAGWPAESRRLNLRRVPVVVIERAVLLVRDHQMPDWWSVTAATRRACAAAGAVTPSVPPAWSRTRRWRWG